MFRCERCWRRAQLRDGWDANNETTYRAETWYADFKKAVCTLHNVAGAKARAGIYWDEDAERDRREELVNYAPIEETP